MKYTGPKIKKARRLGIALTPKSEKYLERRPNPPGQHGPGRRRGKQSDYGRQLTEKQRLRYQYNLSEKQLRNVYAKAVRKPGNAGEVMVQMLESRLDVVILRAGMARTIYQSRQMVSHGHYRVNGQKVNIPSYQVRPGEGIEVKGKSRQATAILEAMETVIRRGIPGWVELDKENFRGIFKAYPTREDLTMPIQEQLIIELYSK